MKEEFITKDSEKKDTQRKRKSTTVNQGSKNSCKIKKERIQFELYSMLITLPHVIYF